MVKRKQSQRWKLPKKTLPKVDTTFRCPFCDHETVKCSLDLKLKIGEAVCSKCTESYATKIHHLTEPIDIYYEWFDACETVNRRKDDGNDDGDDEDDQPPLKRISGRRLLLVDDEDEDETKV